MAMIEAKGYVARPQAKTSGNGKQYSTFTLNVPQKDKQKDGSVKKSYAFLNVTDFKNSSPPPDGAYVTLKGYFSVREYEKDGAKRQSLDVNAQELEVSPPRDGGASTQRDVAAPAKDPWDE